MPLGNLETYLSELPGVVMQRFVRFLCAVKCQLESATKRGNVGCIIGYVVETVIPWKFSTLRFLKTGKSKLVFECLGNEGVGKS